MTRPRRGVPREPPSRTPAGPAGRRGDRGSVTAELAVGLPALLLLVVAGMSAVGAVVTKLECVDTARAVARAAARGEAAPVDPAGAGIRVTSRGDHVQVTVRRVTSPLGGLVPGIPVSASAVAAREPGAVVRPFRSAR